MWKKGLLIPALLALLVACDRGDDPPAPTTVDPTPEPATGNAPPAAPATTPPARTSPSPSEADPAASGTTPPTSGTEPEASGMMGAGDAAESAAAAAAQPAVTTEAPADVAGGGDLAMGEEVYNRTCVTCHGAGLAGAPKLGEKSAWEPRIAQGMDLLYEHSIKGFTGSTGMMPPKGANPALSDKEVRAAVDYMVAQVQ